MDEVHLSKLQMMHPFNQILKMGQLFSAVDIHTQDVTCTQSCDVLSHMTATPMGMCASLQGG